MYAGGLRLSVSDVTRRRLRPSRRNGRHALQVRDKEKQRQNAEARASNSSEHNSPHNGSFPNVEQGSYGLPSLHPIPQECAEEGLPAHSMPQGASFYNAATFQELPLPQPSQERPPNHLLDAVESTNLQVAGHWTPQNSDHGSCDNPQASYLGQSGYMPLLSHGQHMPNRNIGGPITVDIHYSINPLSPPLRESYTEIVLKNCQAFCPALSRSLLEIPEFQNSLVLQQSIGLIGSAIQPSLLHNESPVTYYERAKVLIQGGYETNPLASLIAVMLFYWAAAAPPTVISMNSVWWPCIINPQDCDVREPTPDDFPCPGDQKTTIFIRWVHLCSIVGRVGDHLRRNPSSVQETQGLLTELKDWAQTLPEDLQLPFSTAVSTDFKSDVYQLHLPYLTCITLLHLKRSGNGMPIAYTAAILSASCTARIFEEFLVRGSLRCLQGMAGWYIAVALLALLHGRQQKALEHAADAHIHVLRIALREMGKRWDSAKMYDASIENLLNTHKEQNMTSSTRGGIQDHSAASCTVDPGDTGPVSQGCEDGFKYFPGTTTQTNPLFGILLPHDRHTPFSELEHSNDLSSFLYDMFDNPFGGKSPEMLDHPIGWGMSTNG
ncbi:hypothetical protein N7463_001512 [Penicillium fimorum]|uniref:Transcription factor domain-containing protein n=1 Tax=Penicillium fimorum TaxID=1882269 RepID=A0A9W9Y6G2_9EURO|nr:hypothetical protein N7463_001512 [Penicillium fimorum]